jgi:hypothetical protein
VSGAWCLVPGVWCLVSGAQIPTIMTEDFLHFPQHFHSYFEVSQIDSAKTTFFQLLSSSSFTHIRSFDTQNTVSEHWVRLDSFDRDLGVVSIRYRKSNRNWNSYVLSYFLYMLGGNFCYVSHVVECVGSP